MHLLVSELYIYQNVRRNNKKNIMVWFETVIYDSSTATRMNSEELTRYYNTRKIVFPVREANSDHQLFSPHNNIRWCVYISLVLNTSDYATVGRTGGRFPVGDILISKHVKIGPEAHPASNGYGNHPSPPTTLPFFKVKTGKVFAVHSTKAYRGNRGIIPLILELCTLWIWVANCTFQPPYTSEKKSVPIL